MKNLDLYLVIVLVLIVGIAIGWGISVDQYYNRGISNARLYYQTTGEFPNKSWTTQTRFKTFRYPDQIEKSLEEFTLTK
jgi:hypothetical protein